MRRGELKLCCRGDMMRLALSHKRSASVIFIFSVGISITGGHFRLGTDTCRPRWEGEVIVVSPLCIVSIFWSVRLPSCAAVPRGRWR
ncbi:hypothetical protein SERLADRAFT_465725 [Serpula lacrymans var. lacrymans S7.9]|uniref:Uncharacterized protein n=1 Tax=Serpula lacrymans var. lacrymans (strain S7.9) TaxID=578457 RepID=F8NT06_SERL9|nr:uncharacterized protein SERLADRAFT_465725 [Serpula lacrymans var. lacrymans S7.9]EGO25479.1 hypothetical protein SERLADRAFT_465725 [Serpula lacrymans var. lacrymans S7.9]